MSYQDSEEEQAFLVQSEERATAFKGTTFKVIVASVAAFALMGIGAFMYPETSTMALSSVTDLSFWHASSYHRSTRNNHNSRDIKYLDRHKVDCGNGYLRQFQIAGSIRYSYYCMNPMEATRRVARRTPLKRGGNDGVNYLDRADLKCRSNELMSMFRMRTQGWFSRDFYYDYTCIRPKADKLICHDKNTNWNTYDSLVYLDRHNVNCPSNQAIQQFKLDSHTFREFDRRVRKCGSRHWWGGCKSHYYENQYKNVNKVKYDYKCCQIDTYNPTPVPVARPTRAPISRPTYKPSSYPIAEPTDSPVPEPTEKPSEPPVPEPTLMPTINTKPLVCPVDDLKYNSKKYTSDLPEGCAIVALDDLGWANHESTKGVLICGTVSANGEKFEAMNLKSGGAAKTISYLYASNGMKITYFTEKHFGGASDTFKHGDEPIVHHKIVGADANDAIKSIKFESSYEGNIPTECPGGTVDV